MATQMENVKAVRPLIKAKEAMDDFWRKVAYLDIVSKYIEDIQAGRGQYLVDKFGLDEKYLLELLTILYKEIEF